jgi:hypothetical protein
MFARYSSDKGLISRIDEELQKLKEQTTNKFKEQIKRTNNLIN